MDELPPSLVVEILSRITDSVDLTRCRLVSKTMNSLSREVRAINLVCTLSRYLKSRAPLTCNLATPFKTIFRGLIADSRNLRSISIGVEKSLGVMSVDDIDDESDDLYLSDVEFVKDWLPRVCEELEFLCISDFWIQSCWRRSEVLALISSSCTNLVELELKNAWLSVDSLNVMPNLRSLTLEFIRLDDEDLEKLNGCFPHLEVLNLIGVGGLKQPKIHLSNLKVFQWTVSNAPLSLSVFAPNLVKFKLRCFKPKSLVLETPMLSHFNLSLEEATDLRVSGFSDLKTLKLESSDIQTLIRMLPSGSTVKNLTVDSLKPAESIERATSEFFGSLLSVFPEISSLNLGSGIWSLMEHCFLKGWEGTTRSDGLIGVGSPRGWEGTTRSDGLKEMTARLLTPNIEHTVSLIGSILHICKNLTDIGLLIHVDVDSSTGGNLISRCSMRHPRVRWRWGMWKEGTRDTWVSDAI